MSLASLASFASLLLLAGALSCAAAGTNFYVDPVNGNDTTGTGALDKPWKSLAKANAAVKAVHTNITGDIVVYIRAGRIYYSSGTSVLALNNDQAGLNGYQVIYRNYPGETPVLQCATRVTGWSRYTNNIWRANAGTFSAIIENDRPAVKARYPNRAPDGSRQYLTAIGTNPPSKSVFYYHDGDLPITNYTAGMECFIWPGGDNGDIAWFSYTFGVTAIDFALRRITLNASVNNYTIGTGSRYFLQNALAFLDEPGEYVKDGSTVYYWRYNDDISNQIIVATKDYNCITISGSNIVVDGLVINGAGKIGVDVSGTVASPDVWTPNVTIRNCEIMNTGGHGVRLYTLSRDCVLENNYIHDTGECGIDISCAQGRTTRGHTVRNNYILRAGQLDGDMPGINLWATSSNTFLNNRIENCGRFGLGGRTGNAIPYPGDISSTLIAGNEFVNCMNDSQDGGTIYFFYGGSTNPALRNVIANNIIRDCDLTFGGAPLGIYLDDSNGNFTIEDNLFYNLQRNRSGHTISAMMIKGNWHVLRNNVIVDNNVAGATAAIQWMYLGTEQNGSPRSNKDNICERNIMAHNGSPFFYDFCETWTDDKLKSSENNLLFNTSGDYRVKSCPTATTLAEWRNVLSLKYDQRTLATDPRFMNRSANDYRLRYDSPGYSLGITDRNTSGAGLTTNFPFAAQADPEAVLERVYLKQAGSPVDCATAACAAGSNMQLAVIARTAKGLILDLAAPGVTTTFSSANEAIATVDNAGLVTGVATGMVKITATVTKGAVSKSCDMYVSVDDYLATLAVETRASAVLIGGTMQMYTTGTSANGRVLDLTQTAAYTSSAPAVATIDTNGLIRGIAAGTAVISATAELGGVTRSTSKTITVGAVLLETVTLTINPDVMKVGQTRATSIAGRMSDGSVANLAGASTQYFGSLCTTIASNGVVTATNEGYEWISAAVTLNGVTKSGAAVVKVYGATPPLTPWYVKNYGSAGGYGSYNPRKNEYWIASNGTDAWTPPDQYSAINKAVSGASNYTIIATLKTFYQTDANAQSGIVIRESEAGGAKLVNLRVRPDGGIRFVWRTATDGTCTYGGNAYTAPMPATLKLVREGSSFSAFYKDTGGNWAPCGSTTVSMANNVIAGLTASADTSFGEWTIVGFADVWAGNETNAPNWAAGWPMADTPTFDGFTVRGKIDEQGVAWYAVLTNGAAPPSSAQVKGGQDADGRDALKSGAIPLNANIAGGVTVNGLMYDTTYDVYMVAEDTAPNVQSAPVKLTVTTLVPEPSLLGVLCLALAARTRRR